MLCVVAPATGKYFKDGGIKMPVCVDAMIPVIIDRDLFPKSKESQI